MSAGATAGVIVGVLLEAILFGALGGAIAKKKGVSPGAGVILGILFGLIGLIIVLCLDPKSDSNDSSKDTNPTWECPKCGNINDGDSLFCIKCGEKYIEPLEEDGWYCSNCETVNPMDANFCKHCGTKKPNNAVIIAGEPFEGNNEEYVTCDICERQVPKTYKVKIVDDFGTRYRNACEVCIEQNHYKKV